MLDLLVTLLDAVCNAPYPVRAAIGLTWGMATAAYAMMPRGYPGKM